MSQGVAAEALRIVGLGLVIAVMALTLRGARPELALLLSLAGGTLLLLLVVQRLAAVVGVLLDLAERAQLSTPYLEIILKVIAVSYLVGLGAQIARDAGERALADRMELAGRIIILAMALPIMVAVVDTVAGMLR
ncbi:MAG TPA: stage III sporulation protein AD [Firmicutes bacterium]|nr:stage III sporulation protein AD [Bacillota bacterium]